MAMEEQKSGNPAPRVFDWENRYTSNKRSAEKPDGYDHIKGDAESQLIVHTKADFKEESLSQWLDEIKKEGDVEIGAICQTCDSSLVLLTGEGIRRFIKIQTERTGPTNSSGGKPSGETNDVRFMYNHKAKLKLPIANPSKFLEDNPVDSGKYNYPDETVNVAVFDTGVDTESFKNYLYQSQEDACIAGAEIGWDFNDNNNTFQDDYEGKHGTIIAKLIVNQAIQYQNNQVRILPVKVHNKDGESDLYSILCAFAYAKERGVQIINASFGFYAPRNPKMQKKEPRRITLLKNYIDTYLKNNNIILIAAAGNQSDEFYEDDYRDLDYFSFYPASFARNYENIFATTTVNEKDVCPTQNYSDKVVDIGVFADNIETFEFNNPVNTGAGMIKGSSFAAAILTGKIAANYSRIKEKLNGATWSKPNILKALSELGISETKEYLKTKIKGGVTISKPKT